MGPLTIQFCLRAWIHPFSLNQPVLQYIIWFLILRSSLVFPILFFYLYVFVAIFLFFSLFSFILCTLREGTKTKNTITRKSLDPRWETHEWLEFISSPYDWLDQTVQWSLLSLPFSFRNFVITFIFYLCSRKYDVILNILEDFPWLMFVFYSVFSLPFFFPIIFLCILTLCNFFLSKIYYIISCRS